MKKTLLALLAILLCACCLGACGTAGESQAQTPDTQGNAAPFNMDTSHLSGVLGGSWVNQNNPDDRLELANDLSFTHTTGGSTYTGAVKINETGGMMTVTYADNALPEKSYVWVDSKKQLNANTWYVDGGTFAFGGAIYIRG